jgi:hypothetical protein
VKGVYIMLEALFKGRLSVVQRWMKGKKLYAYCPICGSKVFPVVGEIMSHHWRHAKGPYTCKCKYRVTGYALKKLHSINTMRKQLEIERQERWFNLTNAYIGQLNPVCETLNYPIKGGSVMSKSTVEVCEEKNQVIVNKGWLFETIKSSLYVVPTISTVMYKVLNRIDVSSSLGVDLSSVDFSAMKPIVNWFFGQKDILVRGVNIISQNTNSRNTISWKSDVVSCLPINGKNWNMQLSLFRYGNNLNQTHVYFTINGIRSIFLRFIITRDEIIWLFHLEKFAQTVNLKYDKVEHSIIDTKSPKKSKETMETVDEFLGRILSKPTVKDYVEDQVEEFGNYTEDMDSPF